MSRHYAVFGHPVAHSLSPRIHAAFGKQAGIAVDYRAIDVAPGHFAEALAEFAAHGGAGANVTLPLKQAAFDLCEDVTERARRAGAINTLVRNGDTWHGDNTDGAGLVADIVRNAGVPLAGKRILMLGAGGAARGAMLPLLLEQPRELVIANRTLATAEALARDFPSFADRIAVRGFAQVEGGFDVVINATSASLSAELPPIPPAVFCQDTLALDMMYGNKPTVFMEFAAGHGARVRDGLGMLVEQAAEAFAIWRGVRPDTADLLKSMRQ